MPITPNRADMIFSFQLAEWVGMNPWWGFLGCIIAIFATALAIIFYYKGKKVKLPCYAVRSSNIVSNLVSKIETLEMLYAGKPIENLTVTKLLFWNAGRDTIDYRDVASADPLRVHAKESCKILDAKILYEKKRANKFSITNSSNQSCISIQFDYMDKDEGAVIQLIHTGKSSDDIKVTGTIKGAGKPIFKKPYHKVKTLNFRLPFTGATYSFSGKKARYLMATAMFITPILFFSLLFVKNDTSIEDVLPLSVVFILYWGFGLLLIKRGIPKGFDIFEEEF
jgi:hypothetical protein